MPPPRVPRVVSLLAFVGILWYLNETAPRLIPAVLGLLVLYVALTNLERVNQLFGSAEASLRAGFGAPVAERKGGR